MYLIKSRKTSVEGNRPPPSSAGGRVRGDDQKRTIMHISHHFCDTFIGW
jgi:hypothetical protein